MGVVTFLDLSLFQSGGGGGDPTKFAPRLVLTATTIASPTSMTQVAVSAPDGDVWTISSDLEGFTGATGTGNTYTNIRFPENTGETARDIVVTVTGQYGSNNYTVTQREPLDIIAVFNVANTGNQQIVNTNYFYSYYVVDEDPTQYTTTSYNFQTTGEHTIKFRLKSVNITTSIWRSNLAPTTLVIPDIEIGWNVVNYTGITDITYYGTSDIQYNTGLTAITLPNVTSIGDNAFNGCTALTNVNITGATSIGEQAFYGCSSLTSVAFPNVTTIGKSAFDGCGLTSVTIPSGVTVGAYAFKNCTSLTTCVVGNNCKLSGNFLSEINTLTTCVVGNNCEIGERAFQNCGGLVSLTLGTGCTFTGTHNFSSCSSLPELTLPEGTVISATGQQAYNCTSITALTVNCDVPEQAFRNSVFASNAEVTIGTGCTNIGASAFTNDTGIKTLTFNTGDTWCIADKYAFSNCSGLITADLGDRCDINSKGANSFRACTSLTAITGLPVNHPESDNTVRLRGSAFLNDYALETINGAGGNGTLVIPEGITLIGTRTLEKVGISASTVVTTIDLPSTLTDIANNAISGTQVTAIICRATTAPTITNGTTFAGISASGTLYTPADADYSTWLAALGEGWTQETIPT